MIHKLFSIAIMFCALLVAGSSYRPAIAHKWNHKTCWCDAVRVDNNQNITKIRSMDTQLAFHTIAPTTGDRGDCANKCGVLFDQNAASIANDACNMNMPNGSNIRNAWWIGTQNANQSRSKTLSIVYGQKCPAGWRSNTDGQLGGITMDGKCKGEYPYTLPSGVSHPADGTQIGNWGFFWGGSIVAWGTTQNGGAPGLPSSANGKLCTI